MGLGTRRYGLWSAGGREQAGDESSRNHNDRWHSSAGRDSQSFMRFNDWTFNEL